MAAGRRHTKQTRAETESAVPFWNEATAPGVCPKDAEPWIGSLTLASPSEATRSTGLPELMARLTSDAASSRLTPQVTGCMSNTAAAGTRDRMSSPSAERQSPHRTGALARTLAPSLGRKSRKAECLPSSETVPTGPESHCFRRLAIQLRRTAFPVPILCGRRTHRYGITVLAECRGSISLDARNLADAASQARLMRCLSRVSICSAGSYVDVDRNNTDSAPLYRRHSWGFAAQQLQATFTKALDIRMTVNLIRTAAPAGGGALMQCATRYRQSGAVRFSPTHGNAEVRRAESRARLVKG
ncbi:hypothetical protein PCL_03660 [Purpureocillium lilacinum]|uniref:Uncharacterized protein n=1 Tax=Purpureocillium lilacinum TaxID=33203 RepID=A0A2U3EPM5_PURLI|nr:hypothetical protein PCL_03660 [Purpureocillium lilacinum]